MWTLGIPGPRQCWNIIVQWFLLKTILIVLGWGCQHLTWTYALFSSEIMISLYSQSRVLKISHLRGSFHERRIMGIGLQWCFVLEIDWPRDFTRNNGYLKHGEWDEQSLMMVTLLRNVWGVNPLPTHKQQQHNHNWSRMLKQGWSVCECDSVQTWHRSVMSGCEGRWGTEGPPADLLWITSCAGDDAPLACLPLWIDSIWNREYILIRNLFPACLDCYLHPVVFYVPREDIDNLSHGMCDSCQWYIVTGAHHPAHNLGVVTTTIANVHWLYQHHLTQVSAKILPLTIGFNLENGVYTWTAEGHGSRPNHVRFSQGEPENILKIRLKETGSESIHYIKAVRWESSLSNLIKNHQNSIILHFLVLEGIF